MRLLALLPPAIAAAFMALAQTPEPSAGPSLAEARAVCSAVADGGADFLDVHQGHEARAEETWTSVDVDNDGAPEDIAILTGGSSHTPSIALRTEDEDRDYIDSSFVEGGRSFGPWGGQLRLVRSGGRVYEVFYSDAGTLDYPVYVAIHLPGNVNHWVCSLRSAAPSPALAPVAGREDAAPICAAVAARLGSSNEDFAFTPVEESYENDTVHRASAEADVMNDGRARTLRRLRLDSGAGAGCSVDYYDLADPQGSEADAVARLQTMSEGQDRYPVRLSNNSAACHGNVARFHRINGAVVFEQRFPGSRPDRRDQEMWWVSRVENGRAARLCEASAFERRPRTIEYNPALYPQAR